MILDLRESSEVVAIRSSVWKFSLIGEMETDFINLGIKEDLFPLEIVMPCGCRFQYQSYDDFPSRTVECQCGIDEHKVIEYRFH